MMTNEQIAEMAMEADRALRAAAEYGAVLTSPNPLEVYRNIKALAAEISRLNDELEMWRPLTPKEAEKAFDDAKAAPMSEDDIKRIVAAALDPANTLPNSEQMQLAVDNRRLNLLLARKNEALSVFADPAMWSYQRVTDCRMWNGDHEYRDPVGFARRESDATEPDSR